MVAYSYSEYAKKNRKPKEEEDPEIDYEAELKARKKNGKRPYSQEVIRRKLMRNK